MTDGTQCHHGLHVLDTCEECIAEWHLNKETPLAQSKGHPTMNDALDICACGHERQEHPNNGPCAHGDYHQPTQCLQFRLSATSLEIVEGMEEWARICEEEGTQP